MAHPSFARDYGLALRAQVPRCIPPDWEAFDRYGEGGVTTKELGTVVLSLGLHPTEDELNDMIEEVGPSGVIDFPELWSLLADTLRDEEELAAQLADNWNDYAWRCAPAEEGAIGVIQDELPAV